MLQNGVTIASAISRANASVFVSNHLAKEAAFSLKFVISGSRWQWTSTAWKFRFRFSLR